MIRRGRTFNPEDVDIALNVERYDFAVRVRIEDGRPVGQIEKVG
jgi:hypothetical protein